MTEFLPVAFASGSICDSCPPIPIPVSFHRSISTHIHWCCAQSMHRTAPHRTHARTHARTHTHTHLTALFRGLPSWADTRKVKPIWNLLKQEKVCGSRISWAVCKCVPRSRQITTPAPHRSVFYRPDALPAAQPTVSKALKAMHHTVELYWQHVLQLTSVVTSSLFLQQHHNTASAAINYNCTFSSHIRHFT